MQGACNSISQLRLACVFQLPVAAVQDARFESTTKDLMASHANDPESVMFRDTKVMPPRGEGATSYFLCEQLSAKNRMGG